MELELASLPSSERTKFQPRYKNCKSDHERLKSTFKQALSQDNDRTELLGDGPDDADVMSFDQRNRLLVGTHRLNDASRRLEDSHRVALETEQIGISTLETLRSQREQITRADARLDETNSFIDRNIRLLKNMGRR